MNAALRLALTGFTLVILTLNLNAHSITSFSNDPAEFLKELKEYMTASKNSSMEKVYNDFAPKMKRGMFSEDEFLLIHKATNTALGKKIPANPYFGQYLENVMAIKSARVNDTIFVQWHEVHLQILENLAPRKLKPLRGYYEFGLVFFEEKALRRSRSGVSWYYKKADYFFEYIQGQPAVCFRKVNLKAVYKKDSIQVYDATGNYFPLKEIWKGKGGKGTWERSKGMEDRVYALLGNYKIEMNKTLYKVDSVQLKYPVLFPGRPIMGTYIDKIFSGNNKAIEVSYPRFESLDTDLKMENIGEGVEFVGGFRLHGSTVYGFGTKEKKASLKVYGKEGQLKFKANSELFVIRKEERMAGEGVNCVLYFDQDSLYHPSVQFKLNIPDRNLTLTRGKRGSDRNPFFSSLQQINIDVDNIKWLMDRDSVVLGHRLVSFTKVERRMVMESLKYFEENEYNRLQNISSTNPISTIKVYSDEQGTRFLNADGLAQQFNPRFTVTNINSLIYDMVAKGFINYDKDKKIVEVKDKVFHYADASQQMTNYDLIRIESVTDSTNAVLDLKSKVLAASGVKNLEFSFRHNVALKPYRGIIQLKKNRDMDFDGKLFAGLSTFRGKDFSFHYNENKIELDSIRYFDLFIPSGAVDEYDRPIALSIASRIENASGVLLIDAPLNMSGSEEISFFPSFQSKTNSYVYYDNKETLDSCYSRDSFYFEVAPFSMNNLDKLTKEEVSFKGRMVSAGIFTEFEETLVLDEEDQSLGFVTKTPTEGFENYQGKGKYTGSVNLSNKGFYGQGNIKYLGASINSEDIVFKPDQMTSSADEFKLSEDRNSEIEVPQTMGYDVSIDWRPYVDSMYIRSEEKPFELFKDGNYTLEGLQILTPGGLKGRGQFNWESGKLHSKLMSFGAFSAKADTATLQIVTFGTDAFAFDTRNVQTELDFDKKLGWVKANEENHITTMPYNQYTTSLDEFIWDMAEQTITFQNEEGLAGDFTSIHPDQDSLHFKGKTAFYDLKTNELKIGGVPFLRSCDAFIYPDSGKIEIRPGGVMTTFENARIVADTLSKYHIINRASVTVKGSKEYRASGFYEYQIGDRQQEIEFKDIIGTRIGKGKKSEKRSVTRATGEVHPNDDFYIDHKTKFQGKISLDAEDINLSFEGFAKIDSPVLPKAQWFSLSCEADKKNMIIEYGNPKNQDGYPVATGIFLSKSTARIYPSVMDIKYFRNDRSILEAKGEEKGLFKYNRINDEFIFGDSLRVVGNSPYGNILTLSNKTGEVIAKGKLEVGSGLKYMSLTTGGEIKAKMDQSGNVSTGPAEVKVSTLMMAGVEMKIPDKLLKILITDLQASSFDARPIDYQKESQFYEEALATFIPNAKDLNNNIREMKSTELYLPGKYNKFAFLFSYLPMQWNAEYQSFVNSKSLVGLASVDGVKVNRMLQCHIEFKMPSNGDDRVYIYVKSPSEDWYFFGYKQGVLSMVSSNTRFNDVLLGMKEKELSFKQKDGGFYEIQAVDPNSAQLFVNRIKAITK